MIMCHLIMLGIHMQNALKKIAIISESRILLKIFYMTIIGVTVYLRILRHSNMLTLWFLFSFSENAKK